MHKRDVDPAAQEWSMVTPTDVHFICQLRSNTIPTANVNQKPPPWITLPWEYILKENAPCAQST